MAAVSSGVLIVCSMRSKLSQAVLDRAPFIGAVPVGIRKRRDRGAGHHRLHAVTHLAVGRRQRQCTNGPPLKGTAKRDDIRLARA